MCEEEFGRNSSRFRPHPTSTFEDRVDKSLEQKQKVLREKLAAGCRRSNGEVVEVNPIIAKSGRNSPQLPRLIAAKRHETRAAQTAPTAERMQCDRLGHKLWFGEHLCKSLGYELDRLQIENDTWKLKYKEEAQHRLAAASRQSDLDSTRQSLQEATTRAEELSALYQHARQSIRGLEAQVAALDERCGSQVDQLAELQKRSENQVAALQEDLSSTQAERLETSKQYRNLRRRCDTLAEENESLRWDLELLRDKLKRRTLVPRTRKEPAQRASDKVKEPVS